MKVQQAGGSEQQAEGRLRIWDCGLRIWEGIEHGAWRNIAGRLQRQLWLEVEGKTKESVARCQWSVAQIVQAVKAQGARSQEPVASMEEHSLCFCLLDSDS